MVPGRTVRGLVVRDLVEPEPEPEPEAELVEPITARCRTASHGTRVTTINLSTSYRLSGVPTLWRIREDHVKKPEDVRGSGRPKECVC